MKDDEKLFFRVCYEVGRIIDGADISWYYTDPRDVIFVMEQCGAIHHKRAWYLLKKWSGLGFYDYGTTLDLGWFYSDRLPERYKVLVEKEKTE
jgi:hypothetical protein